MNSGGFGGFRGSAAAEAKEEGDTDGLGNARSQTAAWIR